MKKIALISVLLFTTVSRADFQLQSSLNVDFNPGNQKITKTIIFKNAGPEIATLLPQIAGSDYKVALNRCKNVKPEASCAVTVSSSRASGVSREITGELIAGSLTVSLSKDYVSPTKSAASFQLTPTSVPLIEFAPKQRSKIVTFDIRNSGETAEIPLYTYQNAKIALDRCKNPVAGNKSCQVMLLITQKSNESFTASIAIPSHNQSVSIPVQGSEVVASTYTATDFSEYFPQGSSLAVCSGPTLAKREIEECVRDSDGLVMTDNSLCQDAQAETTYLSPAGTRQTTPLPSGLGFYNESCAQGETLWIQTSAICSPGSHNAAGMECESDVRQCSVELLEASNASEGIETYTGSAWPNVCAASSCSTGFELSGNSCVAAGPPKFRFAEGNSISHSCVLNPAGKIYCLGQNVASFQTFGAGMTSQNQSVAAVKVVDTGELSGKTIVGASYTQRNGCSLASNGTVNCWGNNEYGQLGNGTTTPETAAAGTSGANSTSVAAATVGGTLSDKFVTSVASGSNYVCVSAYTIGDAQKIGRAYCWGSNANGQVGNGLTPASSNPWEPGAFVPYPSLVLGLEGKSISDVTSGFLHTCGLAYDVSDSTKTKKTYCWGSNSLGQIGTGSSSINTATEISMTGILAGKVITKIRTSAGLTCLLAYDNADSTKKNSLYCLGHNVYGQITPGVNSPVIISTPTLVSNSLLNDKSIVDIHGFNHRCALSSDGLVFCWGRNNYGAIGTGSTVAYSDNVYQIGGLLVGKTVTSLMTANTHTCATAYADSDSTKALSIYCWGYGLSGQLGTGNTSNAYFGPVLSPLLTNIPQN